MPPGKKSPALFELIREKPSQVIPPRPPEQARQAPPPKEPAPPSEPPPARPAPEPPAAASSPARAPAAVEVESEPEMASEEWSAPAGARPPLLAYLLDPQRRMSILFISIAVILAYTFIVWGFAYSFGEKQGERQAVSDLSVPDGAPQVREPLREPAADPDPGIRRSDATPRGTTPPPPAASKDPREPGLNYLAVEGRLDFESARRIAAFLTENGVPSIVVGPDGRMVDSRVTPANNAGSFTVYATKGITGKEFRDRAAVRTELEAEVARLGAIWKREYKGRTDLTRTNWAKYSP